MVNKIITNARTYWEDHKHEYPFHVKASIKEPRPDLPAIEFMMKSTFIVCPFNGFAYWGFKLKADRQIFLESYPQAEAVNG